MNQTPANPWETEATTSMSNPWEDGLGFTGPAIEQQPLAMGRLDKLDFWEAMRRNRRNTFFLFVGMFALSGGFGYVLGWAWDLVFGRMASAGIYYTTTGDIDWQAVFLTPSISGMKVAVVLLAAMGLWSLIVLNRGDKMVLSMAGAREADDRLSQLHNVVEEVAIAAGVPKPRVYVIPTRMANAFATGLSQDKASVGITTGLLERLDRRELQAVMAHEMGHIVNDDMRYATLMTVMTGILVFIAEMLMESRRFFYYGGSSDRRGRGGHPILLVVVIMVVLVTAVLVPILARLLQMAVSRQREYLADATAVQLTRDPGALIGALTKLGMQESAAEPVSKSLEPLFIVTPPQMLQNGHSAWFSTHPSLESRIARLKALE